MAGQRDLVARGKDSSTGTHWSEPLSRLKLLIRMIELAEADGLCEREADDDDGCYSNQISIYSVSNIPVQHVVLCFVISVSTLPVF